MVCNKRELLSPASADRSSTPKAAEGGDEVMREMVDEIRARGLGA